MEPRFRHSKPLEMVSSDTHSWFSRASLQTKLTLSMMDKSLRLKYSCRGFLSITQDGFSVDPHASRKSRIHPFFFFFPSFNFVHLSQPRRTRILIVHSYVYVWPPRGRVCPPQKSSKIRSFTSSLVNLALLLDSRFGQVLPVNTSHWPFFARRSAEFIGTGTLVCVPITAPGCRSQNMLASSLMAVAPPRGQPSRHQQRAHQNPRSVVFPMVLTILHCQRKHKLGAARKKISGKLKTLITEHACPKVATLSTTIFGHALFCDFSRFTFILELELTQFKNYHIIVCQEFCQCTD